MEAQPGRRWGNSPHPFGVFPRSPPLRGRGAALQCSPLHSCTAEPSSATREASTRHLLSVRCPQGRSSLGGGGGGGGGFRGGAACDFLRAGTLLGPAGQACVGRLWCRPPPPSPPPIPDPADPLAAVLLVPELSLAASSFSSFLGPLSTAPAVTGS